LVKITVEDNGSGIAEETKARVFEPKFTTKSSGMGLGLAMVKNIVETFKGNITFTSELGKGTVFTVTFPKA
jgi:signal transduction histidine kinase